MRHRRKWHRRRRHKSKARRHQKAGIANNGGVKAIEKYGSSSEEIKLKASPRKSKNGGSISGAEKAMAKAAKAAATLEMAIGVKWHQWRKRRNAKKKKIKLWRNGNGINGGVAKWHGGGGGWRGETVASNGAAKHGVMAENQWLSISAAKAAAQLAASAMAAWLHAAMAAKYQRRQQNIANSLWLA